MTSHRFCFVLVGLFLAGSFATVAAASREEEAEKYKKTLRSSESDAKDLATAVKELGKLGAIASKYTKDIIPDLMKMLDHKDPRVRGEAAHAIGMVDPDEKEPVVDKLIKILKEEKVDSVKLSAAQGLAAMGSEAKAALPALKEAVAAAGKKEARPYRDAIQTINGTQKKK